VRRLPVLAAVLALLLSGCTGGDDQPRSGPGTGPPVSADDPAYDVALSRPVEDRVYPEVGDPGVDALHYDLDLTWDPEDSQLTATEVLVFRATESDDEFQLDLASELEVAEVTLDGDPVDHEQQAKDLVVGADVTEDERYVLALTYSGSPQPTPAPTTRPDLPVVGWSTGPDGSSWTMQEPYGAYTWYAVNDQPADKALYDFTLRVPDPMVGVANGELVSRTDDDGLTVTRWSLDDPAASYLTTVAFGEFEHAEETSASGVPVSIWVPASRADLLPGLRETTVAALDWAEGTLGPYPYPSLGFLYVGGFSGIETQTMITLGLSEFTTAAPVLVHEVVHQWWGDLVTPRDWRDLWMSEGMTTYLQAVWDDEEGGHPLGRTIREWDATAGELRKEAGPPAAYHPQAFAARNVYILPALMWHDIRSRIGDRTFFRLVRRWPRSDDDGTAGYGEITAWWERESGTELTKVFESHLLGERQP
jgi:aminopeptidase N